MMDSDERRWRDRQRELRGGRGMADKHTLRLFWRSTEEQQVDRYLDPSDDEMLRETLEELAERKRGGPKWVDLAEWRLVVHSLGGGQVKATCSVDKSGRTVVTR